MSSSAEQEWRKGYTFYDKDKSNAERVGIVRKVLEPSVTKTPCVESFTGCLHTICMLRPPSTKQLKKLRTTLDNKIADLNEQKHYIQTVLQYSETDE